MSCGGLPIGGMWCNFGVMKSPFDPTEIKLKPAEILDLVAAIELCSFTERQKEILVGIISQFEDTSQVQGQKG